MNVLYRGWRSIWAAVTVAVAVAAWVFVSMAYAENYSEKQAQLMHEIRRDFRRTASLTGRETMHPRVEVAMTRVPRHRFVDADDSDMAYVNRPLSIGHEQTISQPYIVALMTDLIDPEPDFRVLEIGTGSGYQAAVLAELVAEVYTIEIIDALAERARSRLAALNYGNVHVRAGDGNHGWAEHAPFDAIVVTAAGRIPPALVEQLKPGGKLVIPVDVAPWEQELLVVTKTSNGEIEQRSVLPVRFVPLTGDN